MRILALIMLFFLNSCSSSKKISGIYQHYSSKNGFYDRTTIELKANGKFNYRRFNEQLDYQTTQISKGKWESKNGLIQFIVDDEIKPKVSYKINSTIKDSLIIRVYDKKGNNFSDWFKFHGANESFVYPNSIGSELKIPLERKVKKIIFQNKFMIDVREGFNEILIKNASKDTVYDFKNLILIRKGRNLKSVNKILGPTGKKIKGFFKKIK